MVRLIPIIIVIDQLIILIGFKRHFQKPYYWSIFHDGTLTEQKYLELVPVIEKNGKLPVNLWLKQDGAPPHYA